MKTPHETEILPRRTFVFAAWGIPAAVLLAAAVKRGDAGVLLVALVLGAVAFVNYRRERAARLAMGASAARPLITLGAHAQAEVALGLVERQRPPPFVVVWTQLERANIAFRRGRPTDARRYAEGALDMPEQLLDPSWTRYLRAAAKAYQAMALALLGDSPRALAVAEDLRAELYRGDLDVLGAYAAGIAVPCLRASTDLAQGLVLHRERRRGELVDLLARRGEAMLRYTYYPERALVRALCLSAKHSATAGPYRASRGEPVDLSVDPTDVDGWLERVAPTLPIVPSPLTRGRARSRSASGEVELDFTGKPAPRAITRQLSSWAANLMVAGTAGAVAAWALFGRVDELAFSSAVLGILALYLAIAAFRRWGETRVGTAIRALYDGSPDGPARVEELAKWGAVRDKAGAARVLALSCYEEGAFDAAVRWATRGFTGLEQRNELEALASLRARARAALGDERGARADLAMIREGSALGNVTAFTVDALLAARRNEPATIRKLAQKLWNHVPLAIETELLGAVAIALAAPSEVTSAERALLREELGPDTQARRFLTAVAPKLMIEFDALITTKDT